MIPSSPCGLQYIGKFPLTYDTLVTERTKLIRLKNSIKSSILWSSVYIVYERANCLITHTNRCFSSPFASDNEGKSIDIKILIIEMTTSNSMSVNRIRSIISPYITHYKIVFIIDNKILEFITGKDLCCIFMSIKHKDVAHWYALTLPSIKDTLVLFSTCL